MTIGRGTGLRILMRAGLLAIDLAIPEMVLGEEKIGLRGLRTREESQPGVLYNHQTNTSDNRTQIYAGFED